MRFAVDHNSSRPRDLTLPATERCGSEAIDTVVGSKRSKTETIIMLQSDDVGGAPPGFRVRGEHCSDRTVGAVEVAAPNAFAGWMRPLNACGLEATSAKIRWRSADLDCSDQEVERSYRDVRCDGADHYLIVFQVAGQTAMTQIDQAAQLAVGDVALVDAARPVTYLSRFRHTVADASAAAKIGAVSLGMRAAGWC